MKRATPILTVALLLALPSGARAHGRHHVKHHAHHTLRHHRAHKANNTHETMCIEGYCAIVLTWTEATPETQSEIKEDVSLYGWAAVYEPGEEEEPA